MLNGAWHPRPGAFQFFRNDSRRPVLPCVLGGNQITVHTNFTSQYKKIWANSLDSFVCEEVEM